MTLNRITSYNVCYTKLLRSSAVLPLDPTAKVYVAGGAADNIGIQCGGWTMEWQGRSGPITEGTTVLEAIREAVGAENTSFV